MSVKVSEECKRIRIFKNKRIITYVVAAGLSISVTAALIVVLFVTRESGEEISIDWKYSDQDQWPGECQTGKRQSPINLSLKDVEQSQIPSLALRNFEKCDCLEVENNGHTVSVQLSYGCQCVVPSLSGGKLGKEYTFNNLHFHWPSEHTIENVRYALEAHFVFYATQYGNLETALTYNDGLSVVGVLFSQNNTISNNSLKTIANAVKSLPERSGVKVPSTDVINFVDLLPPDYEKFYTYEGSLTTPMCTENVQWIIFKSIANISISDMESISGIYDLDHNLLKYNNRELHPLNGRTIYHQAESE